MILLYWVNESRDKCYYNKSTNSFGSKQEATGFDNVFDIHHLVKNSQYNNLLNLGTENIHYRIYTQGFNLDYTWGSKKDVNEVCERLNNGLNENIFMVQEIIHDDKEALLF